MNPFFILCSPLDFTWLYIHACLSLIGWPRLKWVVTDSKYLTKPSKDWQPHIPTANTDPAYIEVTELLTAVSAATLTILRRLYCITGCCLAHKWITIKTKSNIGTLKPNHYCILMWYEKTSVLRFAQVLTCLSRVSSLCSTRRVKRAQWWVWRCLK